MNKALLTGPDLLCSLVGLPLRFRQFAKAVTRVIKAMFMQIAVPKEDQDALKFLWYKINAETTYKYKRLLFGATCLPSCAIYILQKCVIDNQHSSVEASQSIMYNFTWMTSYRVSRKQTKLSNRQHASKKHYKKEDST